MRRLGSTLYAAYFYYWSLWRLGPVLLGISEVGLGPDVIFTTLNIAVATVYVVCVTLFLFELRASRWLVLVPLFLSNVGTFGALLSELAVARLVQPSSIIWLLSFIDALGAGFVFAVATGVSVFANSIGLEVDLLFALTRMNPLSRTLLYVFTSAGLSALSAVHLTKEKPS